ncbi:hypothetical protein P6144_04640 [Sphingomonas sp. HITSZ_GF]|uniref:DUF6875 domain-containing protein n=1 Tax=Sphingomonas sp. HITSZ_GF TaxID=3037247 RepID=UPI00240D2D8D|nr:hypothetical protein [Sphingomonas sp. HITSZ_GF]MDG2532923.1 hypothetical protein [Sphingomonas sp. HITSZ_GF]
MEFTVCSRDDSYVSTPPEAFGDPADVVYAWVSRYLCGRRHGGTTERVVCPASAKSLDSEQIWVSVFRDRPGDDAMDRSVTTAEAFFLAKVDFSDPRDIYKSVIVAYPALDDPEGHAELERAHKRLKPSFVRKGLMLGQFYSSCQEASVIDTRLKPLQSPIPMLAIRRMVKEDRAFLTRTPELLPHYFDRFPDEAH